MTANRDALLAAREHACTAAEIVETEARIAWANTHDGAEPPADKIPRQAVLAQWLQDCREEAPHALTEASELLAFLCDMGDETGTVSWESSGDDGTSIVAMPHGGSGSVEWDLLSVHQLWLKLAEPRPRHPLGPVVAAWQVERAFHPDEALVNATRVSGGLTLTRQPYEVRDALRTAWRVNGPVTAACVDGTPVAAVIEQENLLVPRLNHDARERARKAARVARPANAPETGEQLTLFGDGNGYGSRHPLNMPVPLIAWSEINPWGGMWLADDVATLVELAHLGPRMRFNSVDDLAYLLARTQGGRFRSPKPIDAQRALNAVGAAMGLIVWVCNRERTLYFPVRLAEIDTVPESAVVLLGPPSWARTRTGRWTLTGAQSVIGQRYRMRGDAGRSTVRRLVGAVEYWLTRTTGKGIAKGLRPASGTSGAGQWYGPFSTREWLEICGEHVPGDDALSGAKRELARRRRHALCRAGYVVDRAGRLVGDGGDCQPEVAIDTVEFRFERRGAYWRASERMTEAAKMVASGHWIDVPFGDYVGRPRIFGSDDVRVAHVSHQ